MVAPGKGTHEYEEEEIRSTTLSEHHIHSALSFVVGAKIAKEQKRVLDGVR